MDVDEFHVLFRAITAPFVSGVATMTTASERAAAAVVASNAAINASNERMAMVARASMISVGAAATGGSAAYQRMAAQTAAASTAMAAASARASAANAALGSSIAAANASAAAASAAMLKRFAMGAAGAALISGAAVHMAGDFEIQTKRLVSSAGETHAGMKIIQAGILDMAGEVGNTTEELAKAMYVIASGGQHGADGLLVLRAAAEGAAAEGAELYEVADAITSVLADYHLEASKSAEVTSKMVAAVGSGKTTFQEFTSSMSAILPIASAAHISFDDISASIAAMTVHGMSARQASQNLADVVRHMVAPTQVQTKELGQLGMSSADLADKLGKQGLTGTLQEISNLIISKMGPSGKVLLNALNVSKEAANSANVMIGAMPKNLQALAAGYTKGDISLQNWRKTLKALPADQANLLAQWTSMQNRAHGFNDILKAGSPAAQTYMDALRRATGDATGLNVALMLTGENTDYVNKTVKKVSEAHAEAGNHVLHWSEIQETFNNKMDRAKAGLGSLAVQVGEKLLPAVSTIVGWLADAAEWLAKHDKIATVLAIALGALTIGLTIATIALWAMNSALLANPITWVIVLIVLFVALLVLAYNKVGWFRTAVDAFFGFIKDVVVGTAHYIRVAWDACWAFFVGLGRWFRDDFAGFFVACWNGIKAGAAAVGRFFTVTIPGFFSSMWSKTKQLWNDGVDWLAAVPGRILGFIKSLPGRLRDAAADAAHRFFYALGYGIGKVYVFFTELVPRALRYILELRERAQHAVAAWMVNTWHSIRNGWNRAVDWVSALPGRIVAYVTDLRDRAVAAVREWWDHTTTAIGNGIDKAIAWVSALPGRIGAYFSDLYNRAVERASKMANDVVAWVSGLPARAGAAIRALPGQIWDAVKGAGEWLYQAGRDIVQGAINGISSKIKAAIDTVKGWGKDISKGFRDAVGISSPSRVFAEAGRFIVAGLVAGIDSSAHKAVAAVANLADTMTIAPSVAVSMGDGSRRFGGGDGPAPMIAGRWRPPAPSPPGDDRPVEVHATLTLDGKTLYQGIVPHAQRHKGRNNTSALS